MDYAKGLNCTLSKYQQIMNNDTTIQIFITKSTRNYQTAHFTYLLPFSYIFKQFMPNTDNLMFNVSQPSLKVTTD